MTHIQARRIASPVLAVIALLMAATLCVADTPVRIKLDSGTIWRGEVNDQVTVTYRYQHGEFEIVGTLLDAKSRFIVVDGTVAGQAMPQQKTIFISDIIEMKAATDTTPPRADTAPAQPIKPANRASRPARIESSEQGAHDGLPEVFVLPLVGPVGTHIHHRLIKQIGEEADKYGDGQIIVFLIESGGGVMIETERIHQEMTELRKRHRLVAWVKKAISAACATAIHCPEMYFMTEGVAGSMTMHANGNPVAPAELAQWAIVAGEWMEAGGRFGHIGPVMVEQELSLSYDKDPQTGEIRWYTTLEGAHDLSRPGENLTFNSSAAIACGFAQGIADNEDELGKALGLPYWYETNDVGRTISEEWTETADRCLKESELIIARLGFQTGADRRATLGKQLKNLQALRSWCIRAPEAMLWGPGIRKSDIEAQIDEVRRRLRDLR